MVGKNIKQYPTRTSPELTDFIYLVAGITDYNVPLDNIKTLFGIGDIDEWSAETIGFGDTEYINLVDSTIYGAVQIEYLAKRGSRGYTTGLITLLVDDSNANGVSVSNFIDAYRTDDDDMGVTLDEGLLSSGTIQLKVIADSSDSSDTIFNYRIISKRVITVS